MSHKFLPGRGVSKTAAGSISPEQVVRSRGLLWRWRCGMLVCQGKGNRLVHFALQKTGKVVTETCVALRSAECGANGLGLKLS